MFDQSQTAAHPFRGRVRPRKAATAAIAAMTGVLMAGTLVGNTASAAVSPELVQPRSTVSNVAAERVKAGERYTIWPAGTVPNNPAVPQVSRIKLGTVFSSTQAGRIMGIRFYRADAARQTYKAQLWSGSDERLASVTFRATRGPGWKVVRFDEPVQIKAGRRYTAAYVTPDGGYPRDKNSLSPSHTVTNGPLTAHRGTYLHGAGRPVKSSQQSNYYVDVIFRPDAEASPPADFPGPDNTGVPTGVTLAPYTGPQTITTPGTSLDAQSLDGSLLIQARDVTISRSHINGHIMITTSGSVTITDSVIDGATFSDATVGGYNMTMRRTEILGSRQSVSCGGNCDIQDSWLHAQYMLPGSAWHGDGFISNGGSNVLLRHNTLACDTSPTGYGGACSAALAAYGDFAPISNHTYDNNLFVSSPAGYCMYAGYEPRKPYGSQATNVRVTNNVFQRGSSGKCAVYGPVASVAPDGSAGNVFSGNVWDDGTPLAHP